MPVTPSNIDNTVNTQKHDQHDQGLLDTTTIDSIERSISSSTDVLPHRSARISSPCSSMRLWMSARSLLLGGRCVAIRARDRLRAQHDRERREIVGERGLGRGAYLNSARRTTRALPSIAMEADTGNRMN